MGDNTGKGETYRALRVAMNFYALLGVLPMTGARLRMGNLKDALVTCVLCAYAATLTSVQMWFYVRMFHQVYTITLSTLCNSSKGKDMALITYYGPIMFYYCVSVFQTVQYWAKGKQIKEYAKRIDEYQVLYHEMTGHKIVKPLRRSYVKRVMLSVTLLLGSAYGTYTTYIIHTAENYVDLFYRCDDLLRVFTDAMFCLLCIVFTRLGQQFRQDFDRDFRKGLSQWRLNAYVLLRLRLATLVNSMKDTMGIIYGVHLLHEFPILYLNCYSAVVRMKFYEEVRSSASDEAYLVRLKLGPYGEKPIFYSTYIFIKLITCVNFAQKAESEMEQLLKSNVLSDISDLYNETPKVKQLKTFLRRVNLTPINISMLKNVHVNKGFFCSFLCSLVYYTSTLLQFHDAFEVSSEERLQTAGYCRHNESSTS